MRTNPALQVTKADVEFLSSGRRADERVRSRRRGGGKRLGLLTHHHSGPERHYHNLHHVAEMLRLPEQFEGRATDTQPSASPRGSTTRCTTRGAG